MKKFIIAIGILGLSLACIGILKNLIIKSVLTSAASRIIGAPVHMDGFSLNVLNSTVHITGLKIYNPRGFPEGILVFCPKIKIIYDRGALFKQKRHFLLVAIELKEMRLAKNKEGKLNVDSLKIVQQSKSSPSIPMQIDLLTLSIGRIIYQDYTGGTEHGVRVYDVNRHKVYKGVPTAQQLAVLVLSESMKAAAIHSAEIYGVVLVGGVVALPVAVVATFIGKDNVQQIIDARFSHVYDVSLQEIKRIGWITKDDASVGVINANINGAKVTLILRKRADNKTEISISARKYLLPQLDIAARVLYQIIDTLQ